MLRRWGGQSSCRIVQNRAKAFGNMLNHTGHHRIVLNRLNRMESHRLVQSPVDSYRIVLNRVDSRRISYTRRDSYRIVHIRINSRRIVWSRWNRAESYRIIVQHRLESFWNCDESYRIVKNRVESYSIVKNLVESIRLEKTVEQLVPYLVISKEYMLVQNTWKQCTGCSCVECLVVRSAVACESAKSWLGTCHLNRPDRPKHNTTLSLPLGCIPLHGCLLQPRAQILACGPTHLATTRPQPSSRAPPAFPRWCPGRHLPAWL